MRLDYGSVLPEARTAMLGLEQVVHDSSLEPGVVELVKLRASQMNGCARCVEMHAADARVVGEDQRKLDLVAVWREASCFTAAERAALGWCEALTLLAEKGASDVSYGEVAAHFDPDQLVALTLAVAAINAWNRLNVGFGIPDGGYRPTRREPERARPSGPAAMGST